MRDFLEVLPLPIFRTERELYLYCTRFFEEVWRQKGRSSYAVWFWTVNSRWMSALPCRWWWGEGTVDIRHLSWTSCRSKWQGPFGLKQEAMRYFQKGQIALWSCWLGWSWKIPREKRKLFTSKPKVSESWFAISLDQGMTHIGVGGTASNMVDRY